MRAPPMMALFRLAVDAVLRGRRRGPKVKSNRAAAGQAGAGATKRGGPDRAEPPLFVA